MKAAAEGAPAKKKKKAVKKKTVKKKALAVGRNDQLFGKDARKDIFSSIDYTNKYKAKLFRELSTKIYNIVSNKVTIAVNKPTTKLASDRCNAYGQSNQRTCFHLNGCVGHCFCSSLARATYFYYKEEGKQQNNE